MTSSNSLFSGRGPKLRHWRLETGPVGLLPPGRWTARPTRPRREAACQGPYSTIHTVSLAHNVKGPWISCCLELQLTTRAPGASAFAVLEPCRPLVNYNGRELGAPTWSDHTNPAVFTMSGPSLKAWDTQRGPSVHTSSITTRPTLSEYSASVQ